MAQENNEIDLIKQAQDGHVHAFEQLINLHYDTIFKMAFKWCGNRNDAEDITQDVCIKLAKNITLFKGESRFTSWLYRVTINTAKDWYKKHKRHTHQDFNEIESAYSNEQPEEILFAKQVLTALQTLPEGEKDALILVVTYGLSHKEAADILDVKESTVSWRVHEARKKLKVQFEKEAHYG